MKKFLSLVLALAMTMSLVTVSAGAKDFADADSIQYAEAVDVMTAIGVVDGDTAGNFNPTAGLTRGAAAKIICNLILGPTTAAELNADADPYVDVDKNSTFAGYIAYCKNAGIISGYADGTFKPAAPLTGYAFMKMLLGALGYDGAIEGYTGANWSINVAKQAISIGLNSGLKGDFNGSAYVTREEAMLYAFNMIQADLVEYDTQIIVNNGTLGTSTGIAKAMTAVNSSAKDGNIDGDGYIQFAELYFNKLVKTGGDEAFSRPSTTWYWKGVEVGTYASTADKVYYGDVDVNDIYKDLGMTSEDVAEVYYNGVDLTKNNAGRYMVNVAKSNEDSLADIYDGWTITNGSGTTVTDVAIGNGTNVEVYLDTDTNDVTICIISVFGGKISAVYDATKTRDTYVVVDGGSNLPTLAAEFEDEFETEDFEEDAVVAYTYSLKTDEIKTMEALESVTGGLDKRVVGKSLTIEGTTYKYAAEYTFDGIAETSLSNKNTYVVYTDANGYALWIEEDSFNAENFALVLAYSASAGTWSNDNVAKLLFTDGTIKTVDLDKAYAALASVNVGSNATSGVVVSFRVNDDGEYVLSTKTTATDVSIANNFAISTKNMTGVTPGADAKTIFVVNTGSNDYKTYTGIKNAPTITGATGYAYGTGTAKLVFSVGGSVVNSSKDVTYIALNSVSKLVTSADVADYYQYNAVVNGEIKTIDVLATADATDLMGAGVNQISASGYDKMNAGDDTWMLFNDSVQNPDDQYTETSWTLYNTVRMFTDTGIKAKAATDEVRFGTTTTTTMGVANDCGIYVISTKGEITEVTLDTLKTDNTAYIVYTVEDGEVTNIFVQKT